MSQSLPFLDEELKKKKIFDYFPKKESDSFFLLINDIVLLPFFKKTKYIELAEISRLIFSRKPEKKKKLEPTLCTHFTKIGSNNSNFNDPSMFIENQNLLRIFSKNQFCGKIYCAFVEYSLYFEFYDTTFFLIENLEKKTWKDKYFFIRINIIKIDFYFYKKNYKKGKNIINFLHFLIERDDINLKDIKKIQGKAGKLAIRENKMPIAFSYFLESFGKTEIFDKNGHNKIFEFLIFVSNFIKKQKINSITQKNIYSYNISNFIFLEFINKSLQNKNLIILEGSLKKKIWNQENQTIKFFLSKFFNSTIINSIKILLKPFLRISLGEISVMTGVTKKKLKMVISKIILNGEIKGILDQEIDSFVAIRFKKNSQYKLSFLKIIIQMNHIISEFA